MWVDSIFFGIGNVIKFIFGNPLVDIGIILLIVGTILWSKGFQGWAYLGLGTALMMFVADFSAPPWSACTFAKPGMELLEKSRQGIFLSDDLLSCTLAKAGLNFKIFDIQLSKIQLFGFNLLPAEIPLVIPVAMGLVIMILVWNWYASTISHDTFESIGQLVGLALMSILFIVSIDGAMVSSIYLTTNMLIVLVVVPVLLWMAGWSLVTLSTQVID